MDKKLRKRIATMVNCGAGLLCSGLLVWGAGAGTAYGAYVNPFTTTPAINLSPAETAAYLEQKTREMFSGAPVRPEDPYVAPTGWRQDVTSLKHVRLEKYTSRKRSTDKVILQLHGGGYIQGNHNRHRDWAIARAEAIGHADVYMLNYRFYPEAKYPAALEDAAAAYQELRRQGISADDIVVMGDSAGGNLALALTLYLRDRKIPQPGSLVLYSPWGDAGQLPSRDIYREKDVILGERNTAMYSAVMNNAYYFAGSDLRAPYISPVYGDFAGLPPMLIIAGAQELFVDDCCLLAQRGKEAGVEVELHLYPGMSHDWPLLFPELPESKDTYAVLAKFIEAH